MLLTLILSQFILDSYNVPILLPLSFCTFFKFICIPTLPFPSEYFDGRVYILNSDNVLVRTISPHHASCSSQLKNTNSGNLPPLSSIKKHYYLAELVFTRSYLSQITKAELARDYLPMSKWKAEKITVDISPI